MRRSSERSRAPSTASASRSRATCSTPSTLWLTRGVAKRRSQAAVDREEVDRLLDQARYFLRLAIGDIGANRDDATLLTIERLALLSAGELRSLTVKHRAHPATRLAVQALDRAGA